MDTDYGRETLGRGTLSALSAGVIGTTGNGGGEWRMALASGDTQRTSREWMPHDEGALT